MTYTYPHNTSLNLQHCLYHLSILLSLYSSFLPSDPNERAFFWIPNSTLTTPSELLDTPLADRMYIDPGEVVRVRVEADDFGDDEPGPTKQPEAGGMPAKREQRRAPYVICVRNRIMWNILLYRD